MGRVRECGQEDKSARGGPGAAGPGAMQILGPETHPAGSGRPGISSGFFPPHTWLCRGHVTNCSWGLPASTPWLQGGDHLALWTCRPSSLWVRQPGGPRSPAVHVLRDRGIGDGLGRRLQAGLAVQAAAVAAEAGKPPPRGDVGGDAPGLGVEGVVVIDVVIVSVPRMTWDAARREGRGRLQGSGILACFPIFPPRTLPLATAVSLTFL